MLKIKHNLKKKAKTEE